MSRFASPALDKKIDQYFFIQWPLFSGKLVMGTFWFSYQSNLFFPGMGSLFYSGIWKHNSKEKSSPLQNTKPYPRCSVRQLFDRVMVFMYYSYLKVYSI